MNIFSSSRVWKPVPSGDPSLQKEQSDGPESHRGRDGSYATHVALAGVPPKLGQVPLLRWFPDSATVGGDSSALCGRVRSSSLALKSFGHRIGNKQVQYPEH
ncbi:hypothetical protein DPMN_023542 [Dreissena polymorpha]|uniref:Uncharacterized protein n=1 Tax=Dreissena polymorpha TaxID=45954 RepID=A0A9D4LKX2_DREPO|nr:hypothetical protein DPMN_023542 [Dreissena polymorpha]